MAVMVNERVMLVVFVEPTFVVMIIRHAATCTDGDEKDNQGGAKKLLLDGFHALK